VDDQQVTGLSTNGLSVCSEGQEEVGYMVINIHISLEYQRFDTLDTNRDGARTASDYKMSVSVLVLVNKASKMQGTLKTMNPCPERKQ